jgi:hypothetical protein
VRVAHVQVTHVAPGGRAVVAGHVGGRVPMGGRGSKIGKGHGPQTPGGS